MGCSQRRRALKQSRLENGLCAYCGKELFVALKKGCVSCLEKKVKVTCRHGKKSPERIKAYYFQKRLDVITKYGGECVCCGESNPYFLTIDHINNDGAKERRLLYGSQNGASRSWFLKLIREPIRIDLQILCGKCNQAKGLYGKCPHDPTFIPIDMSELKIDRRRKCYKI